MSNNTDSIDGLEAYIDDVDDSLIALLAQRRELADQLHDLDPDSPVFSLVNRREFYENSARTRTPDPSTIVLAMLAAITATNPLKKENDS
ncbi:MAG: hypothetical protein R5N75_08870 [Cutibacterium granulosum]|uniref:hypothetical protein n=1 Tax=Cutibacterium granulosum TaxID=33011 RepID=UPI002B22CF31|nr:hypothetical protein [Cutibacterium granulosum]MEA5660203.1 hypothetical protein [Cutibacterium granulosum]